MHYEQKHICIQTYTILKAEVFASWKRHTLYISPVLRKTQCTCIYNIAIWNFNGSLTNDIINFDQLAQGILEQDKKMMNLDIRNVPV